MKSRSGFAGWLVVVLLLVGSREAAAQDRIVTDRADMFASDGLFSMDLEGAFRWRTDFWHQMDMGLYPAVNKYGVTTPWGLQQGKDSSAVLVSSDFRLRLHPVLHVGERGDLHLVVDLLDTQAGDSITSDFARTLTSDYGVPIAGLSGSSAASMAVRMAWGELFLFHIVTLKAGRMPANWGLGIVENDASNWDTNGGDAIDGVTLTGGFGGMKVAVSLDWPLEGTQATDPFSPWAPPLDLGDRDDIWQWRAKFERSDIYGPSKVEFGLYGRLRFQEFTSLGGQNPYEVCASAYDWDPVYDCTELFWRNATVFTPDAYIRFTHQFNPSLSLRLEGEIAARYASLSATQRFSGKDTSKTLYGLGGVARGVLEAPHEWKVALEFGAASGDEGSQAFGILDRPVVAEPDDSNWEGSVVANNDTVTSFALHPNYLVDQILFRNIVGAVTNSWYLKPSIQTTFATGSYGEVFMEGSVLFAQAFVASSTPGEDINLGAEADVTFGADLFDHVQLRLQGGLLFPFEGLTGASTLEDPMPWTARILMNVHL